ncbi:hypothetical protein [Ferrimonas balearica]|uniref:hypothetical protein n=1 Tax=Ferrimonas balearica TaxID=44012 RepID=UPI001C992DDA|nr:hypothetical protein [Ferrimonas balearica]MBY5920876.1 hypothetical protein [Ferrimonas balearica]MBY5996439.1 hypothetical protein [Ferrimonas balearica]
MLPVLIYGDLSRPVTQFLVLVCEEKGVAYCIEPHSEESDQAALQHEGGHFYSAIAAAVYLDALLPEISLLPESPVALGAMWESLMADRLSQDKLATALAHSPFLVGETLTLADLYWYTHGGKDNKESDAIVNWRESLSERVSATTLEGLKASMEAG